MVYIVRHGETDENVARVFVCDQTLLNDVGVQEAKDAATNAKLKEVETIYTSPLARARQTAEIIASELGLKKDSVVLDDDLAERDVGTLLGASFGNVTTATMPDDTQGAERFDDVVARAGRVLDRFSSSGNDVLLVTHNGFSRFLRALAEDAPSEEIKFYPSLKHCELYELIAK